MQENEIVSNVLSFLYGKSPEEFVEDGHDKLYWGYITNAQVVAFRALLTLAFNYDKRDCGQSEATLNEPYSLNPNVYIEVVKQVGGEDEGCSSEFYHIFKVVFSDINITRWIKLDGYFSSWDNVKYSNDSLSWVNPVVKTVYDFE